MTVVDDLLAGSRERSRGLAERPAEARPALRLTIVTCMDCRVDVPAALGLELGQAHVLRNAGGIVTDDVLRSLVISQRLLQTEHVMVVQHTDCGMQKITDEGFRAELQAAAGEPPPFAIGAFDDLEASVRRSVERLRESRFLPRRDGVRGFVYDVADHSLREVE